MNSERGKFSSQDQELDKDNLPFWLLLSIVLEILDNVIRQNVKGVQNGEENKDKTVYFPMHSDCLHIIPKHLPKKKTKKRTLEQICELADHRIKINIQKCITFLHTINEKLETVIWKYIIYNSDKKC